MPYHLPSPQPPGPLSLEIRILGHSSCSKPSCTATTTTMVIFKHHFYPITPQLKCLKQLAPAYQIISKPLGHLHPLRTSSNLSSRAWPFHSKGSSLSQFSCSCHISFARAIIPLLPHPGLPVHLHLFQQAMLQCVTVTPSTYDSVAINGHVTVGSKLRTSL